MKAVGLERDGSVIWETEASDNAPEGIGYRYTAGEPPTDDEMIEISIEAAARRVGSAHEEVVVGSRFVCPTCGEIDQPREAIDVEYHPEAFVRA